ncbi:hypothetical protein [Herbaspirillum sp.]|uniref:hypothetical protein n=1 Tax=Herbaspirillum sp. TaxID=1890675 RepID=UPI00258EFC78|nr:hypothetical protein [Herbaspirillum sp.]MCP3947327.1 hypothetical protein [Herbaspirillum sp.]
MTAPTLTKQQVLDIVLTEDRYHGWFDALPGEDGTAYTPSQMAKLVMDHDAIVWAFLRPGVLGDAFGAVVCRIAEVSLPAFEVARPGDTRARAASDVARRCFDSPTAQNRCDAKLWAGFAEMDAADAYGVADGPTEAMWSAWAAALAAARESDPVWAGTFADRVAGYAVDAGAPRATIRSIIEGAGQ